MAFIRTVAAALALLGVAALAGACTDDEPETAVEAFDEGGEERVELVTGEPFEATAVVDDVLGPRGFLLLDTLVVTEAAIDITEGSRVRVTGEVATAEDAREAFGEQLGDEVADALESEDVVVVAEEIEVVDRAVDD